MNFIIGMDYAWWMNNIGTIILVGVVVIEWVALQALLIHYHLFRQSLKRPTPDGIRFQTIEKVLSFHANQMDRIFGKLSELNKEISTVAERKAPVERSSSFSAQSAQHGPSVMSLGEMNLKKRLNELRAIQTVTEPTSTKIN